MVWITYWSPNGRHSILITRSFFHSILITQWLTFHIDHTIVFSFHIDHMIVFSLHIDHMIVFSLHIDNMIVFSYYIRITRSLLQYTLLIQWSSLHHKIIFITCSSHTTHHTAKCTVAANQRLVGNLLSSSFHTAATPSETAGACCVACSNQHGCSAWQMILLPHENEIICQVY